MLADVFLTILTVIFSLTVVFSKRTVVSAFALLMTLITVAMIYFQLGTIFLSAVQVLINAGAIAILFVFVMMLINLDQFTNNRERNIWKLIISAITMLVLMGVLAIIINNNTDFLSSINLTDNSMNSLFSKLFDVYYLPFEMATVLLLAAIVACVVITSKEKDVPEGIELQDTEKK